jgi:hypothetical protein
MSVMAILPTIRARPEPSVLLLLHSVQEVLAHLHQTQTKRCHVSAILQNTKIVILHPDFSKTSVHDLIHSTKTSEVVKTHKPFIPKLLTSLTIYTTTKFLSPPNFISLQVS